MEKNLSFSNEESQERLINYLKKSFSPLFNTNTSPSVGAVFFNAEGEEKGMVTYQPDLEELTSAFSMRAYEFIDSETTAVFTVRPALTGYTIPLLKDLSAAFFCVNHPLIYARSGYSYECPEFPVQNRINGQPLLNPVKWIKPPNGLLGALKAAYWGRDQYSPEKIVDEIIMGKAVDLAKSSVSKSKPLVGSIIMKDNKIIGMGTQTDRPGAPGIIHAERSAITNVFERLGDSESVYSIFQTHAIPDKGPLEGSTLYVTLEPCLNGTSKVSCCSDLIINSGIKEVRYGIQDLHYHGRGITHLRQNGVNTIQISGGNELYRALVNIKGKGQTHDPISKKITNNIDNPGRVNGKKIKPWKRKQRRRNRHRT